MKTRRPSLQAREARNAFLSSLPAEARVRAAADAGLDGRLGRVWDEARRAWPAIELAAERFFAFLGGRAPDGELESLRAGDLYLACACADGDPEAMASFERLHLGRLRAALAPGASPDAVDEVLQRVRVEILVRDGERAPGIAGFRGRSDLHAWLRVVGARELARVEKRGRREIMGATEALWADLVSSDPELAYIKDTYRHTAVLALQAALGALPDDDRELLRQHLVDGLSIDEIGARAGVHRATAARRLERARERVADAMRREIERRLQLGAQEIDELLHLVRSRLDVSVRRVLSAAG
jgi:RNA polymerase sigma-70 factor (ECF subfamily)